MNAWLVFIDESGLLLAPIVRRTWSPRAHTPVHYQVGRHRQKVSAIAALCVSPDRRRVCLFFRLLPNANVDSVAVVAFLRHLRRHLPDPILVVWDRLNSHVGRYTRAFLARTPSLQSHLFPAYAPELDPVEYVWGYLKGNPLANHACADVTALTTKARHHTRSLQHRSDLLRSFLRHAPLPLRLR